MSRQILDLTLRLPDGKVLKGRGRNLVATVERVYNQAQGTVHGHVLLAEHLKRGYVAKGEDRYQGTFHARFMTRGGALTDPVVAEVKGASKP